MSAAIQGPQPTAAPLPPPANPAAPAPAPVLQERSPIYHELDLSTLKKVGEGAYGRVYSVYHTTSKTTRIIKTPLYEEDCEFFKAEYENTKSVRERKVRHVIPLLGFIMHFHHPLLTTSYGLVFPDRGFSLHNICAAKIELKMAHLIWIAGQILETLHDLHRLQNAHRDLTPKNVLMNDKGKVTVIDWASLVTVPARYDDPITAVNYRAPEEFMQYGETFDGAIDIWAFGCILYMIVTKEQLFPCFEKPPNDREVVMTGMVTKLGTPSDTFLKACASSAPFFREQPKGLFHFLFPCLGEKGDAEVRLRSALISPEISATPDQVEGVVTLFNSCLRWDPKERITAKQALRLPLFQQVVAKK